LHSDAKSIYPPAAERRPLNVLPVELFVFSQNDFSMPHALVSERHLLIAWRPGALRLFLYFVISLLLFFILPVPPYSFSQEPHNRGTEISI
jgi:hypothetical protein